MLRFAGSAPCMASRLSIAILLFVGFAATAVLAQMSASDQVIVTVYQATIKSAESRTTAGGIEAAFTALASVREALTLGRGNNPSVLESLSDAEFERLQRELPGALVNREETLFIEPDPDYFMKLAAAHGDQADRRFFAAFKTTYPKSIWPIYVEQQTDYSGCTAFGTGNLVEAYRVWSSFQSAFPNRYVAAARKELSGVSAALTESTCACEDASSVQRELQRFVQMFPASPLRAKIDERLKALQAGRSDIRVRCISG